MSPHSRRLVRQLATLAGDPVDTALPVMLRHAKRRTHPDLGGDTADAARVNSIESFLREAKVLT